MVRLKSEELLSRKVCSKLCFQTKGYLVAINITELFNHKIQKKRDEIHNCFHSTWFHLHQHYMILDESDIGVKCENVSQNKLYIVPAV